VSSKVKWPLAAARKRRSPASQARRASALVSGQQGLLLEAHALDGRALL